MNILGRKSEKVTLAITLKTYLGAKQTNEVKDFSLVGNADFKYIKVEGGYFGRSQGTRVQGVGTRGGNE